MRAPHSSAEAIRPGAEIGAVGLAPSRKDTTTALLLFKYGDPWQHLPLELRRMILEHLWRYTFACYQCRKTMVVRVPSAGIIYWLNDERDTSRKLCSIDCAVQHVAIREGLYYTSDRATLRAQFEVLYDFYQFQKALDLPLVGQMK
jgi:hypothetical protein